MLYQMTMLDAQARVTGQGLFSDRTAADALAHYYIDSQQANRVEVKEVAKGEFHGLR